MDHEEHIVVEFEHDALADPADAADDPAVDRFDRRINGSKNERAEEMNSLEAPSDDVACQRFEVDDDIRELGHSGIGNCDF
jgi:hypothetical protein